MSHQPRCLLKSVLLLFIFLLLTCSLCLFQIKVVNAFRSSIFEVESPHSRSSIHNFMAHPEFLPHSEEEAPRFSIIEENSDAIEELH